MTEQLIGKAPNYQYKQQDVKYMGQPLHSSLADGPTQTRKCRDFLCLLLYMAFWIALIAVAIVAFKYGQPHLLAAPFDSTGRQCGYSPGYQNHKYGYYNQKNHSQFCCISDCPGVNGLSQDGSETCMYNGQQIQSCSQQFGNYSTKRIVSFCFPLNYNTSFAQLGLSFFDQSISDLKATWIVSLSIVFICFILSLILLLLIRACGGCLVVSVIFSYFAVIVTFGVICLLTEKGQISIPGFMQNQDQSFFLALAIIAFTIAGISLLILLCRILVIKLTAEFTRQEFQTVFVPIVMFIVISLFFAFWITVSIFIFSSGKPSECTYSPFACIDWNVGVKRSLAFYFFGLFWNCQVAIGMCQFVLASTTAFWYFQKISGKKVSSPVCKSFCRGMFYHLGSIAFGALILCILIILQIFFQILHYTSKEQSLKNTLTANACTKCCIGYVKCCLACFQRFIRFISRNAFIMMAITGSGFCSAAHEAFYLILRVSQIYAVSHGIGYLIMFFGKLLVTSLCTFIGYIMITQISYFSLNIYSPVMPTIIFFVISYAISSLFMDVFGIGSDTLLMCYCVERDIIKGKPKSCPPQLLNVIQH